MEMFNLKVMTDEQLKSLRQMAWMSEMYCDNMAESNNGKAWKGRTEEYCELWCQVVKEQISRRVEA